MNTKLAYELGRKLAEDQLKDYTPGQYGRERMIPILRNILLPTVLGGIGGGLYGYHKPFIPTPGGDIASSVLGAEGGALAGMLPGAINEMIWRHKNIRDFVEPVAHVKRRKE